MSIKTPAKRKKAPKVEKRKRERQYALFFETPDGVLIGYIEESFTMGLSRERVRVWDGDDGVESLRLAQQNGPFQLRTRWENNAWKKGYLSEASAPLEANERVVSELRVFLVRVHSNNPIEIDMKNRGAGGKFDWRNRPFTVRGQDAAISA